MQERKFFGGSREKLKSVTELWWAEQVAGEREGSETMPHWDTVRCHTGERAGQVRLWKTTKPAER